MSSEKEIVNYWLSKRGYFTITNLKIRNKDVGIIALKPSEEILHVQINCSISSAIDGANLKELINETLSNFFSEDILEVIGVYLKDFRKIKKVYVVGSIPRKRRLDIVKAFKQVEIEILEFDKILLAVILSIDKQYYKNDVLRTLQLIKYLLLKDADDLVTLLSEGEILNTNTRYEFLSSLLEKEVIKKQFKKLEPDKVIESLKYFKLKPDEFAQFIEKAILTSKTRKKFIELLLEEERVKKEYVEIKKIKEKPLTKFF